MTALTTQQKLLVFDEYRNKIESKEDLPKGSWMPSRFCFQDYVLSIFVTRIWSKTLEVALFAAEDHFLLRKDSGVKAGLICLLGEAYYATGCTEVLFRGPVRGNKATLASGFESQVPEVICNYASGVGVKLSHSDRISNQEGRKLIVALAEISEESCRKLELFKIDPVHVALQLFRKVWRHEHVSLFLQQSQNPAEIFSGSVNFAQRVKVFPELVLLRNALMEERFFQLLATSNSLEELNVDVVWESPWKFRFSVPVKCFYEDHFGKRWVLSPGKHFAVAISAEHAAGYNHLCRSLNQSKKPSVGLMLVTRDFQWTQSVLMEHAEKQLRDQGTSIVSIIDSLAEIDEELMTRLAQSASTRRPILERPG